MWKFELPAMTQPDASPASQCNEEMRPESIQFMSPPVEPTSVCRGEIPGTVPEFQPLIPHRQSNPTVNTTPQRSSSDGLLCQVPDQELQMPTTNVPSRRSSRATIQRKVYDAVSGKYVKPKSVDESV